MAVLPVAIVLVAAALGCPTYEDTYSGTYREPNLDPVNASRAIQVDFFRYGGNVSAVLRFFEPSVERDQAYASQSFCTWADGAPFDRQDRTFTLPIEPGTQIPESTMQGAIVDGGQTLEIEVRNAKTDEAVVEETSLRRTSSDPKSNCSSFDLFLIRARFDLVGEEVNRMPPSVQYDVEHPVFSIQWVGRTLSENNVFVPTDAPGASRRLEGTDKFVDGDGASKPDQLEDQLGLSILAPPERIRIESGDTSYALGHAVVIDDNEESGSFSWEIDSEPIVASALQPAVPVSKKRQLDDDSSKIDGWGRAILFVEDDVSDLAPGMRQVFFEKPRRIENGRIPQSHFYVVDVFYNQDTARIRQVSLPENLREHKLDRGLAIKMTARYLGDDAPELPRLLTQ